MVGENAFLMAGTEGTFEYVVLAVNANGRVGVREFAPGRFRIRLEPTLNSAEQIATVLTREDGWKQPGDWGQYRFSKVVRGRKGAKMAVLDAMSAIGTRKGDFNHVSAKSKLIVATVGIRAASELKSTQVEPL